MSSAQWLRQAKLTIRVSDSQVLDVSEMRFRFRITRTMLQTPNHADIRIYNLSDNTAETISQQVRPMSNTQAGGRPVIIEVGYSGLNLGVIFKGDIIQVRLGRESQVDTYTDILAYDGDMAYTSATVSVTIPDGTTLRQRIQLIADAFAQYKVTFNPATLPKNLPEAKKPRGGVLHGEARELLRQLSNGYGYDWSIQNGELIIVEHAGDIGGEVVVLNSDSGLIGLPESTPGGIMARCLINPNIKVQGLVKIDQKSIQDYAFDPAWTGAIRNNPELRPKITKDGIYKVLAIDYVGDTRGNEWYQILTLLTPEQLLPSTLGIIQQ